MHIYLKVMVTVGQITNNSKFSLNQYGKKEGDFLVYLFPIAKSPAKMSAKKKSFRIFKPVLIVL